MIIRVKDSRVHGSTGYMEVDLVSVQKLENGEVVGPVHTYGVDAHIMRSKYSGAINLWLAAIKSRHEVHSGAHHEFAKQIEELKGKEL